MGGRMAALILSTVAMAVSFSVWAILSPMASTLQKMYHLTAAEKGLLVATPVLLGSVMRIPMGILTDRVGGRKAYTLTMLFLILPLLGASVARSYATLLLFAFLIGMAGTTFAIAIAYVSRWFPLRSKAWSWGSREWATSGRRWPRSRCRGWSRPTGCPGPSTSLPRPSQ